MSTPARDEDFLQFLKGLESNVAQAVRTIPKPSSSVEDVPIEPPTPMDMIPQEDEPSRLDTEEIDEEIHPEEIVAPKESVLTIKNLFTHSSAHPLILDLVLMRKFDVEWLAWEHEVLWEEIKSHFNHVTISQLAKSKIQAVRTCHVVESPWKAWEVFVHVCHAFNNIVPDMRTLIPPTPTQIMTTVDIMDTIDRTKSFSEEVSRFIAACFLHRHIWYLPEPVTFAQTYASRPVYICTKCGRMDLDDENQQCDYCSAPHSEMKHELTRDYTPVRHRYNVCVELGDNRNTLEENVTDIQVAKLLVAREYMLLKRSTLHKQAEVLDVQLHD